MPPAIRTVHQQDASGSLFYDFIEIGTAGHTAITHYCGYDHSSASSVGEEIRTNLGDLRLARGLAVDPIREHLDALPDLPHVQKVEAAMDEWSGQRQFYFVSPENIREHMGWYKAYFPTIHGHIVSM